MVLLALFALTSAQAATSQIDLPGAVACYHELKTALGIVTDYPPGYVAVRSSNGKGALLFTDKSAKLYALDPTPDGEFMELWGDSADQMMLPEKGRDALTPQNKALLADHLLKRLALIEPKKPAASPTSGSLKNALKNLKARNEASAPSLKELERYREISLRRDYAEEHHLAFTATPEEQAILERIGTPRARGENPAPQGKDITDAIDEQNAAFDRLDKIAPPAIKIASQQALQKALTTCAGIKGESRVSTKAQALLDGLNSGEIKTTTDQQSSEAD